jgi:hypothetical protein
VYVHLCNESRVKSRARKGFQESDRLLLARGHRREGVTPKPEDWTGWGLRSFFSGWWGTPAPFRVEVKVAPCMPTPHTVPEDPLVMNGVDRIDAATDVFFVVCYLLVRWSPPLRPRARPRPF